MLAKDIMTTEVITVSPDTSVADIAALLLQHHISAVPVVDGEGGVLGIVSEGDLLHRPESDTERRKRSWWLQLWAGPQDQAEAFRRAHGQRAEDVMTRNAITVTEDTSAVEIAETLEARHIKRVPVMRDGRLVGIVSRANLLRGLATQKSAPLPPVAKDDQALQQAVLDVLNKEPWANLAYANATVENGVVHLWGYADSADQRKAYEVAAANVPGVISVANHLHDTFPEYFWAE
jgi:CBS domain-containing protein